MKIGFWLSNVLKTLSTRICSLLISVVEYGGFLSRDLNYLIEILFSYLWYVWETYTDFFWVLFWDELEQKCQYMKPE